MTFILKLNENYQTNLNLEMKKLRESEELVENIKHVHSFIFIQKQQKIRIRKVIHRRTNRIVLGIKKLLKILGAYFARFNEILKRIHNIKFSENFYV